MKTVYIYINGILNRPGSAEGWTDRAVTWTHLNTDNRAEKFEYFTTIFTHAIGQSRRAKKYAKMVRYYKGWDIVLVGHSNGCDVVLRILRRLKKVKIKAIHLLAGACETDMVKNGVLSQLEQGLLGNVKVYLGGQDKAMWAAWASKILKPTGFGYGDLGGSKPEEIAKHIGKANVIYKPKYDHGAWWEEKNGNFSRTMKLITAP